MQMSAIPDLLAAIRNTQGCSVVNSQEGKYDRDCGLPDDLREFYEFCNGATLFERSDYKIRILGREELRPSNEIILGEQFPDDITNSWFVIAECSPGEHISIDLSDCRLGWCYDSFHDVHGVAGSCPIISKSFTEFLQRCLGKQGEYLYWLEKNFKSYGDAYDTFD
jgi:antitoxin YokJ